MSYLHDIFISYKRDPHWDSWTRDHLSKLISTFLRNDLDREPSIFIDKEIEPASDWPQRLGNALGRSRALVAVLNSNYFRSPWCQHELDLILERRSCFPANRIIVPLVLHNCEILPEPVARISTTNLKEFYNPYIQLNTTLYFQFTEEVKKLSPHIARAIRSAPDFDSSWIENCISRFNAVYSDKQGKGLAKLSHLATTDASRIVKDFPGVEMP